jgi:uncharacterized protein YbjQ (UPF0145 family)
VIWGKSNEPRKVVPENTHVAVVTSGICQEYDVIDSIHELASQDAGFAGHDLNSIFEKVKNKLRERCLQLGGDAVIDCHFSERSAHSGGLVATQVIEMWAYGTVVKLRA